MTSLQFIGRRFALLCFIFASPVTLAASFTPLGDLPGGNVYGIAYGISATGRTTVVGYSSSESGNESFRWTSNTGMVGLGHLNEIENGFNDGSARGVTSDGRTVVGYSNGDAFRWTASTGMVSLGAGYAWAVSADGKTIAGNQLASQWSAGIWTEAAGFVSFGFEGLPAAVSADGNVVAGWRLIPYQQGTYLSTDEAFRWTSDGGAIGLGDLPGGPYQSYAYGVSGDGSVVVGTSYIDWDGSFPESEAFRWTEAGGMVGLGHLTGGGSQGTAYAASSDGSIVVGDSDSIFGPYSREAFIWTEDSGMVRLADLLTANGAQGLDGWTLESAQAISPDGRRVAGYGINPLGRVEAYTASIVTYVFTGFAAPVDNLPNFNTAKAGRIIPLKWRVTDTKGAPVTTLTSVSVTATSLTCRLGKTGDQSREYSPGRSGLKNLGNGYYQFNWKTPTDYARSCKTLNIDLGDGEVHTAVFKFTR